MAQDFFHSMMSRKQLADYYSDFHKDFTGYRPRIPAGIDRAGLCACIEQLEEQYQINKP